ncbi:MAG: molybdopterin-dependent oxidoreductase [Planctomycetes bacterium]|nr:molybdopterin-dependent oxidoreductase [Planctomycetota bacterium]
MTRPLPRANGLDRRDLLKAAAMSAAAAALAGPAATAQDPRRPAAPPELPGVTWDKAPCRFCGTGCHVLVGTKEKKVVAIAGHPDAEVNRGLLCVKGYHVGSILYGQDRLTRPLLRKDGALVPVSWEEALDVIARRIRRAPDRFALYGSGQWTIPEGYAALKFMKAGLSSNQLDPNARLCMASAVTGFLATYGVDEPASCYDDLDRADVVIMWGNNPAEMHPVLFSRIIDRRSRGERVRIIDLTTRRTRTSEHADLTLHFAPQTDLAIANMIARQLVKDGTYDREFVKKHVNFRAPSDPPTLTGKAITFEEYAAALEPYTPEHVSKLSGIPAAQLMELYRVFADRSLRVTSLWCMGMNQHTRGTAINCLVHGVHLLSGHWGKPGDGPTSLTGQPSACGTVREVGTLAHALPGGRVVTDPKHRAELEAYWNLPAGRLNPKPGHHTVDMWKAFCSDEGDLDTLWVQVTNPGQSLPNTNALFEAKARCKDKFLIVSDVYPTATTALADLILPSALWVEKNGVYGNSERRTHQWFRQVDPPGEARDDAWQTIAVARRLLELGHEGMTDQDGRFLFHTVDEQGEEVPVWEWARWRDVDVDERLYEEYRPLTHKKHKHVAPYRELTRARGLRWPVVQDDAGVWRETRWRFVEGSDPFVAAGKGFQFYHSVTGDDRALVWFHPYEPPPEVPDAEYDLWLCTGRVLEHWHTGTLTMRVPQLRRAVSRAYAELHPEDARRLGVRTGDQVVIESRRGRCTLPAWIDGRGAPPRGTVFVPFFDERHLINAVTLEAHDPFSKQPDYKKCAVRVRKAGAT